MRILLLPDAEYLRECFDYSPDSGALLWRVRPSSHFESSQKTQDWNNRYSGRSAIHVAEGRTHLTLNNRRYKAPRILWKLMSGNDPVGLIDHRDTDPLNNRWTNLREATHSQNRVNSRGHHDRKSRFKGVSRWNDKWQAFIKFNGQAKNLGVFEREEDAADAYSVAAAKLHGDYANIGVR